MLRLLSALVICVWALPAVAATPQGILYDCNITDKKDRLYWIADKIAIVALNSGEVMVSDQVILRFNDTPLAAQISRNNDRRMTIRWTLKNIKNSDNQHTAAFEYTATLSKKTNRISVHASPDGYPDRFSGKGSCTPRTE